MDKSKAEHQCLFCRQKFDSVADKDNHIPEHFVKETCAKCNENLIRIGGYLYVRHNEATCIEKVEISEEHVESCTSSEPIQTTPKSLNSMNDELSNSKNFKAFNQENTLQTQTGLESMSSTRVMKMITSVSVDGLSIQKRFPNVNLNPVVVLEDILKNADTAQSREPETCKMEADVHDGGVYTRQRYLQTHVHSIDSNNRNAKKYKCKRCGISYNFESNMQKHMESVHSIYRKYNCNTCDMTFKERRYLADHMTIHTGEKPYKCTFARCKERFRTRYQKSRHITENHSKDETFVGEVNGSEKTFSSDESLKLHSDKEYDTPTTNYSCYICSKVFNVKTNLVKHIEEEHASCNTEEQPTWKKYIKPQNDQNVVSSHRVENNITGVDFEMKEGELLIELDPNEQPSQQIDGREWGERDETFQTRNLNNYKEVSNHDDNGEFNCEICGKKFSRHSNLRKHVRNHRDPNYNRTYEHCSKRFRTREQKSLHVNKVHSEGFVCGFEECKQVFTSNVCLKSHVDKEHHMFTPLQTQQTIVAVHPNQLEKRIEIKVEELLIESESNGHQSQQDNTQQLHDRNETIVAENVMKPNQIRTHTGSGKFVCEICKKSFKMRCYLEAHVRRKHRPNAKKFKCEKCGISCMYLQELRIHVDTVHHNIRKYKCNTCEMAFKRMDTLRDHETIHTEERPFKCSYKSCGMRFKTQRTKKKHERKHSPICKTSKCGKAFAKNGKCVENKEKVHGISEHKYSCDICSQVFNLKMNLLKHIQEKHSSLEICSAQQDQIIDSSHQEDDNPIDMEVEIKVEEEFIDRLLNEPQNQQNNGRKWNDRHKTILAKNATESNQIHAHTKAGEFVCKICKKSFKMRCYLQAHVRRNHHPNVEKIKCDLCGISYINQRILRIHIETVHHNIRKYKCNTCGKSFKRSSALRDHETIHKEERPFKCLYEGCGKRFKTKRNKVQHDRIHTGEKPYVCGVDGCGEEFAYNRTFKTHLEREHGISALRYACQICTEVFDIRTKLMKHMEENHPNDTEEL